MLFKQHIQGLPLPPLEPIWVPHDPEEISAFEQNLISIQRLYLCQSVLAKVLEVVGALCWQLLEQGLAAWAGQGAGSTGLAEATMLQ